MKRIEVDIEKVKKMYVDDHMRAEDIGAKLGVSSKVIFRHLKENNIQVRKKGWGFNVLPEINFTKEQYEFFDGLMLSDGHIFMSKSSKRFHNGALSCAFKYEEFASYINNYLELNGNLHKKIHKSDRYKSGECIQYGLMSKNNIFFTKERSRWYDDKKIIPRDFRFSPISMNIAYLGDGFLHNNASHLSFNNFSNEEIYNTIGVKLEDIGLKFSIYSNGVLRISKKSTPEFLNYIGECPIECYKYKWGQK